MSGEPDFAAQAREIIETPVAYGSDVNEHYSMEPHRHLIEDALSKAYASGRRRGLTEAADAAYKACPEMMNGLELRDAIRALMDKEGE